MHIAIFINLFSPALAVLVLMQKLFLKKYKPRYHILSLLIILLIFCIPIKHLIIAEYIYGVLAGLSISSICLLVYTIIELLKFNKNNKNNKNINLYFYTLSILGLIIYPFHLLIITKTDPNSWGFSPIILSLVISLLSIIYFIYQNKLSAIILLITLISFNLNLLNSANLWNYLIDPFLFIYAFIFSAITLIRYLYIRSAK